MRPSRTCALDGCEADITAYRWNKLYCRDAHRRAAFRLRRANGEATFAMRPSERFLASSRVVAPELVIEDFLSWLDQLPAYVGDHYNPEAVFEALLSVPDAVEEIADRYAAAPDAVIYGADEPDGEP